MCPLPPSPATNDIGVYWADEEIFTTLEKIANGSPLPGNVVSLNPCQYNPSFLPADIWYFISSSIQKEADIGSWKTTGEACITFEGLGLTGWRTSYKYCGDQDPDARKPDWIMQEYKITSKGMLEKNRLKEDTGSICRVFLSSAQGPSTDGPGNLTGLQDPVNEKSLASYLSEQFGGEILKNGQGSGSRSHDNGMDDGNILVPVVADGFLNHHPVEDMPGFDGDYLELLDLDDDPARSSLSSENSSCISMNSDDYFDSLELLRDLETRVNSDELQKSADSKFNISASLKPNEVVMHLESAEFLATGNREDTTPAQALRIDNIPPGSFTEQNSRSGTNGRKVENDNGGSSSNPICGDSSSRGHRATIVKRGGASSKKTKILKYFCFLLD